MGHDKIFNFWVKVHALFTLFGLENSAQLAYLSRRDVAGVW